MPGVKPISQRIGPLPKSSSFDVGVIPGTGQRVYLHFQTTWKEAGYFTINLIVVDAGQEVSLIHVLGRETPGERLEHGAHRIGHFLGKRHDKWWHLCEVESRALGGDPAYWRKLRLELREGNWAAGNYDDEKQVIDAAVADVTRDVACALRAIGVAAPTF